jgi:glutamate racemase
MPAGITTVAQGELVANSLKDYLLRHPEIDAKCTKKGNCTYCTTEAEAKFSESASAFLNKIIDVQHIALE